MEKALLLYYPACDTCRKAVRWINENKIDVELRDIKCSNPSVAELREWLEKSGLPINKFFNTSGKIYKDENLKEKVKSESKEALLSILASNGMVVKRPIFVSNKFVLVGFNVKEWSEKLLK